MKWFSNKRRGASEEAVVAMIVVAIVVVVGLLVAYFMFLHPYYSRWQSGIQREWDRNQSQLTATNEIEVARLNGEATKITFENEGQAILLRAENTKRAAIAQAQAELEAAEFRAQAIQIMGEIAQQYPEYRHQEFISQFGEALQSGEIEQIIYVPTEANIPIVEARRE